MTDESGNIIQFPAPDGYDGVVCQCGSAWFKTSVTLGKSGSTTGYTVPLECVECGATNAGGAS